MSATRTSERQILSDAPENFLGPLNDIEEKFAPKLLYVSGDLRLLDGPPRVAVIGTRKPTPEGAARARHLVRDLVKNGIIIVSGLADGIDSIAHRTAIENQGKTIAVLGTPLNEVYPRKNRELQFEIMEHHLVISQFAEGSPVRPWNFTTRNRTMALISDASVIVEAGEGSGTISQGWETLRLGKPLFIMRSVCEDPMLIWPKDMIKYGARSLEMSNSVIENIPSQHNFRERCVAF
jgi:DNA processing protein